MKRTFCLPSTSELVQAPQNWPLSVSSITVLPQVHICVTPVTVLQPEVLNPGPASGQEAQMSGWSRLVREA